MTKQEKLQQLDKQMADNCKCALKYEAIQAVAGSGTAEAQIVFVGEAPGAKEDKTGEPFVGAAGKVLSELLDSIGLAREDVYITNIVKYRPPNNRDPLPEEVATCWPWLQAQLAIIKPKIIVPLGRHALARFVLGCKISEDHGKLFHREIAGLGKCAIYASYHPAASIYNRKLRNILKVDFAQILKILQR